MCNFSVHWIFDYKHNIKSMNIYKRWWQTNKIFVKSTIEKENIEWALQLKKSANICYHSYVGSIPDVIIDIMSLIGSKRFPLNSIISCLHILKAKTCSESNERYITSRSLLLKPFRTISLKRKKNLVQGNPIFWECNMININNFKYESSKLKA